LKHTHTKTAPALIFLYFCASSRLCRSEPDDFAMKVAAGTAVALAGAPPNHLEDTDEED